MSQGVLFSVNQGTVENIPNLFARNERVVSIFDTDQGPMAVIMVWCNYCRQYRNRLGGAGYTLSQ